MSEEPRPAARYGESPCSEEQCQSQFGAPCEYVDRRSRECLTSWCPEHQYIVGESVYCRRHAGVMAALFALPEEERECPDLDNRAPSLLEYVARRLHHAAVEMLQLQGSEHPGSSIVVDAMNMTMAGTPRLRGWEHRWRLLDHTGPLATIGIRVDEDTDSVVQVKVDASIVHSAEASWITVREVGIAEDIARRQSFDNELVAAMRDALQRRREFRY